MWCIPPQEDARFVAAMEDVLEVYARPYDPKRPVVCLDEAARQLLQEVTEPLPARPGIAPRSDNQYKRNGTCSLFMLFEPLAAKRWLQVREQRTARDYAQRDYAQGVKWLLEEVHPEAQKVVLVQDNLNIRPGGTRAPTACTRPWHPRRRAA